MDDGERGAVGRVVGAPVGAWTPPVDGSPRRVRRSDRVVGVVLVALWVAWLVITLLGQTRLVSGDRLRADLEAGRVTAWRVVAINGEDVGGRWASELGLNAPAARPDGTVDRDQQGVSGTEAVEYLVDSPFAARRVVDPATVSVDVEDPVAVLRAAGVPPTVQTTYPIDLPGPPPDAGLFAAAPLVLVIVVCLAVGPRPTRASRWAWFWLLGIPLGLGALAYAVLEQVRPGTPVPAGGRHRFGGWSGFGASLVASLVVGALVTALADGTHWLWVVRP